MSQQQQAAAAPATASRPTIQRSRKRTGFIAPPAFEGPPLPRDVERLKSLTARERVEIGYRLLKESTTSKGTASFRSTLPRDPYNLPTERIVTQQQVVKQRMLDERRKQLVQQYSARSASAAPDGGACSPGRPSSALSGGVDRTHGTRSSSWARDTTPRGNYMFNWTAMPQCIPRNHVDPTPGPGAYTPALHFVGGTH